MKISYLGKGLLTELGKAASSVNEAIVIMIRNVNSGVRVVFHLSTTQ